MNRAFLLLKSVASFLSISMLSLVVYAGISVLALSLNLTKPDVVKSWFNDSNFYENVIDATLSTTQTGSATDHNGNNVSVQEVLSQGILTEDEVEQILKKAVPPELIRSQFEGAIDAIYAWLNGESDELKFNFDLSRAEEDLTKELAATLKQKISQYEVCDSSSLSNYTTLANEQCLPPGVSPDAVVDSYLQTIDSQNFLGEGFSFSSDDLNLNQQQLEQFRQAYGIFVRLPNYLILAAFLLTVAVVLTAQEAVKGLRRSGHIFFVAGVFSWVAFYLMFKLGDVSSTSSSLDASSEIGQKVVAPLFNEAISDIAQTGMWLGLISAILGILIWAISHLIKHESKTLLPPNSSQPVEVSDKLPKPVAKVDEKNNTNNKDSSSHKSD